MPQEVVVVFTARSLERILAEGEHQLGVWTPNILDSVNMQFVLAMPMVIGTRAIGAMGLEPTTQPFWLGKSRR